MGATADVLLLADTRVQITVDGQIRAGSFANITALKETPGIDTPAYNYAGESFELYRTIVKGFQVDITFDDSDEQPAKLLQNIITAWQNRTAVPRVDVTITKVYLSGKVEKTLYAQCSIMPQSSDGSNRTDPIKWSWVFKTGKRSVLPGSASLG